MTIPPVTLLRTLGLAVSGRLRFPKDLVGRDLTLPDGERFEIFRQAVVDKQAETGKAAVLVFRFRFAAGSPDFNKRASRIPIPLIVGFPGFHTKIWAIDPETGAFFGLYEWASAEDAERYVASLAITLMRKRAAPGTVEQTILGDTNIAAELAALKLRQLPDDLPGAVRA